MSEYLLQQYQPVAYALLDRHGLRIDPPDKDAEAREFIAKKIMHARELPHQRDGTSSPLASLRSASKHAAALEKQRQAQTARSTRLRARCIRLADALCNDWISSSLGVAGIDHTLDDNLRRGELEAIDFSALIRLLTDLEGRWLKALQAKQSSALCATDSLRGRKRGINGDTIAAGLFIWKMAGRLGSEYFCRDGSDKLLSGPLPCFLRDLLACSGLRMSNKAIHHSIILQQRVTSARVAAFRKLLAARVQK